jgi:WXG100 family type VII secretion target
MATDEIKMDYDLMEEMRASFRQGSETLQDTQTEVQNLASTLEDGALLGDAGEGFTDAIRSKLAPAIAKLDQKFQEMVSDLQAAENAMREADQSSKSEMG